MANPRDSFVGSQNPPGPGQLTSLNTQPKRGLIPRDRVYTRVMILIERQKRERGPKLERAKKDPKKGQVNIQPLSKKPWNLKKREREEKAFQSQGLGV